MRTQVLFATLTLSVLALAGCADDPPAGTVGFTGSNLSVNGEAIFTFTEFEGHDPTGTDQGQLCQLDAITGSDPSGTLPTCQQAGTEIRIMLHEAPELAEGTQYMAYLAGGEERALGGLALQEDGMWLLEVGVEGENLDGVHNGTEIRLGDQVLFTGGASSGGNPLEVTPDLSAVTFNGEFTGADLTLEVSGLPDGAFEGWLISEDPETGEKSHAVSFPVGGSGTVTYTAPQTLDHYSEVHIHIAGTTINVGIGPINVQ